jgi:hypothetical protein
MSGMNIPKYYLDRLAPLVGGKITKTIYDDDGFFGLAVEKEGKIFQLLLSSDDEGNAPGSFFLSEQDPKDVRENFCRLVQDLHGYFCKAKIGKKIGRHRWVHSRCLTQYFGMELDGLTMRHLGTLAYDFILKIDSAQGEPSVSFLDYENFFEAPHPKLIKSTNFKIEDGAVYCETIDYRKCENKPILHRKELLFYSYSETIGLPTQERLPIPLEKWMSWFDTTKREEAAGLYENTKIIGTENGWESVCKAKGWK